MSKMKPVQNGQPPQGYQQQYPSNEGQQAPPHAPLANYTLPGVISYLTSEFTKLERFKIVTSLEKSEMRYKIQQLTSEVNLLRFVNDKQKVRIHELERELAQAKGAKEQSGEKGEEREEKREKEKGENGDDVDVTAKGDLAGIPEVDLEVLRTSRNKLNRSIREVVRLLRPPAAVGLMDLALSDTTNGFDELLDDLDNFVFDEPKPKKDSIFARYTLGTDDLLFDSKDKFDDEANNLIGLLHEASDGVEVHDRDESDAETVIVDELEPLAPPDAGPKVGPVVHLPALRDATVFPPFHDTFVILQAGKLDVWHDQTRTFSGALDEQDDVVAVYYVEKQRVLVVTAAAVYVLDFRAEAEGSRKTLLYTDTREFIASSLVELGRAGSGVYGLALAAEDAVVVLEVRLVQKPAHTVLAEMPELEREGPITAVAWAVPDDAAAALLPKRLKLGLLNSDTLARYEVLYAHARLLKVNLVLKAVATLYDAPVNSVDAKGRHVLVTTVDEAVVYDLKDLRTLAVQPVQPGALYALLGRNGTHVVTLLDALHVRTLQFDVVASEPIGRGEVMYCDSLHVIVHNGASVEIVTME